MGAACKSHAGMPAHGEGLGATVAHRPLVEAVLMTFAISQEVAAADESESFSSPGRLSFSGVFEVQPPPCICTRRPLICR